MTATITRGQMKAWVDKAFVLPSKMKFSEDEEDRIRKAIRDALSTPTIPAEELAEKITAELAFTAFHEYAGSKSYFSKTEAKTVVLKHLLSACPTPPSNELKTSYEDLMRAIYAYQKHTGQTLEDTLAGKWTAPSNGGWLPIEEAPKDGTVIIGIDPDGHLCLTRFKDEEWRNNHYGDREVYWYFKTLTHFMFLPAPPKESK